MRRFLFGALALVVLAGLVLYAFRKPLTLRLMEQTVARNLATNLVRDLPDGLHVALCGAGSPLPDPNRSGPCVAVVAGPRLFIVDAGSGSSRNLSRMRVPQGEIEAILLTHFHSDHIDGLGELLMQRWVNGGHTEPVPVHGPEGVQEVVAGFDLAYRADDGYRVAHHGADTIPPSGAGAVARPFAVPADGESQIVLSDGELEVISFRVDHAPIEPAVGYRFRYQGRSVLVSGDTVDSPNVRKFAKGVDLLVHEALAPQLVKVLTKGTRAAGRPRLDKITTDILDYHTTPVEAASIAQEAGAGHLLFYHIVPPLLIAPMEDIFLEGVDDAYNGPVTLGRDGTLVSLEAGTDAISVRELL